MHAFSDTKGIFQQLAETDGAAGVQTIIENHEAWVRNGDVQAGITAAMRAQLARSPRPELVNRRIVEQRKTLAALAMVLPMRLSSAG